MGKEFGELLVGFWGIGLYLLGAYMRFKSPYSSLGNGNRSTGFWYMITGGIAFIGAIIGLV